jgi:hypothetical protein
MYPHTTDTLTACSHRTARPQHRNTVVGDAATTLPVRRTVIFCCLTSKRERIPLPAAHPPYWNCMHARRRRSAPFHHHCHHHTTTDFFRSLQLDLQEQSLQHLSYSQHSNDLICRTLVEREIAPRRAAAATRASRGIKRVEKGPSQELVSFLHRVSLFAQKR